MKKPLFFLLIIILTASCKSQNIAKSSENKVPQKSKLVIGIVVDQMRYDYLIRFKNKYGNGGFKRLINEGYNLKNVHFNYVPTHTAVGHTSIYTGTTPENHGIMGNNWYDKYAHKIIYCVNDANYKTLGSPSTQGQKSPSRMFTTTIGDQLHLAQNMHGKVIGISLKDRAAILPAGHSANVAYWFDGGTIGNWISSSYYMNTLPKWVENFNASKKANEYLNQTWNTYYDISTYTESIDDNNNYEQKLNGKSTATFPYDLKKLRYLNDNYSLIFKTPFGNSLITDFALETIKNEHLGKGKFTDFLAISYSSTDYIGHTYGVDSKEIEDVYIRMDKEIERLLNFLDKNIGKNNYSLFLTADHGAVNVPNYLKKLKIPAGYFDAAKFKEQLNQATLQKFGSDKLIESIYNKNVFLNKTELKNLKLNKDAVVNFLIEKMIQYDKVYKVISAKTLQTNDFTQGVYSYIQRGYNQKLSGDIVYALNPATISSYYLQKGGAGHGVSFSYDTHVPLIFYGNGINKGESNKYHPIVDIAPTMCNLLEIEFPSGNTGKVIEEVLK